jgi:hypothetical protein
MFYNENSIILLPIDFMFLSLFLRELYFIKKKKSSEKNKMTEEELNKPVTLNNLMETLVTFNEEKAIPRFKEAMKEVMMDGFANFNVDFLKPAVEELKVEIKKSEQVNKDWTDKRVGEAEGRIIPKINTLTNVLKDKNVIDEEEREMVVRAGKV